MSNTPHLDFEALGRLIQSKGALRISHDVGGGGVGLFYCATVGGGWPFCHGTTVDGALSVLLSEHQRITAEQQAQANRQQNSGAACQNDTDGDGDCHLCHRMGGCPFRKKR